MCGGGRSQRGGSGWGGVQLTAPVATHVERLFGFVREQRLVCEVCAAPGSYDSVEVRYGSGLVWYLPNPGLEEPKRVWTATELYFNSVVPGAVEVGCAKCASTIT